MFDRLRRELHAHAAAEERFFYVPLMETARELSERLIHHLDEEETEVFPVAGRVLSDDAKAALAVDYRSDVERHRSDS